MQKVSNFKQAKDWLTENQYPLDLVKHMINFNIIDLANLLLSQEQVDE